MWLVLVGVLMVYLLCFLIYTLCHTTRHKFRVRRISSTPIIENPSSGSILSASLRPDGTILSSIPRSASAIRNCCPLRDGNQRDHHWNWRRRNFIEPNSTSSNAPVPPSCLYYDEITQRNSDLPKSALTAQREQQLRQIKLEINELSRRLGIGQLYRERQLLIASGNRRPRRADSNSNTILNYHYSPTISRQELSTSSDTFTTSSTTPETLARIMRATRRTRNTNSVTNSFTTTQGPRCLLFGGQSRSRHRAVVMMEDRHLINDDESSSSDDSSSLDDTTLSNSNSAPFAPHTSTNSCSSSISLDGDSEATFSSEAATGLGLVQTFTLGNRSSRRNEIFHQRQRRLRLIRMEIEDLTLQLSSLSEDRSNSSEHNGGGCSMSSSDLEGLVTDQDSDGDGSGPNMNSSSPFPCLGELPSYDESIHLNFDDSPPPSYDQCTLTNANNSNSTMFYIPTQPCYVHDTSILFKK